MIAEVTQRIQLEGKTYAELGKKLDAIHMATLKCLDSESKDKCDFVSFNTHPCKALAFDEPPRGYPPIQFNNEGAM